MFFLSQPFCFWHGFGHTPVFQIFCQLKWRGQQVKTFSLIKIYHLLSRPLKSNKWKPNLKWWLCTSSSSLPFKHTTTSTWLSIQSWGLVRIWSRILFRFCSFLKVIEFKHPKARLCRSLYFYRLDHWWTFSETSLTNFFWRLGWQRCQLNVSWCFWSCQSLLNIIFT